MKGELHGSDSDPRGALRLATAFLSGLLFALGLAIGGMLNPNEVLAFLDLAGNWSPSLAFVMAGALGVYAIGHRALIRRPRPWLEDDWKHMPATGWDLSPRARFGALVFGAGWGLAGFCPGPAIVSIASFRPEALTFAASMILGFVLHHFIGQWEHKRASRRAEAPAR
jgi:uncharacterized membrane protein YedE/YeeE